MTQALSSIHFGLSETALGLMLVAARESDAAQ